MSLKDVLASSGQYSWLGHTQDDVDSQAQQQLRRSGPRKESVVDICAVNDQWHADGPGQNPGRCDKKAVAFHVHCNISPTPRPIRAAEIVSHIYLYACSRIAEFTCVTLARQSRSHPNHHTNTLGPMLHCRELQSIQPTIIQRVQLLLSHVHPTRDPQARPPSNDPDTRKWGPQHTVKFSATILQMCRVHCFLNCVFVRKRRTHNRLAETDLERVDQALLVSEAQRRLLTLTLHTSVLSIRL
mmetsp:Transcript_4666/g.10315  ORF Transcript_4666/g.10315 Transcript_4666/m.10315 type:complete len:242 (-) Transcript_4666:27-752(-)